MLKESYIFLFWFSYSNFKLHKKNGRNKEEINKRKSFQRSLRYVYSSFYMANCIKIAETFYTLVKYKVKLLFLFFVNKQKLIPNETYKKKGLKMNINSRNLWNVTIIKYFWFKVWKFVDTWGLQMQSCIYLLPRIAEKKQDTTRCTLDTKFIQNNLWNSYCRFLPSFNFIAFNAYIADGKKSFKIHSFNINKLYDSAKRISPLNLIAY